jgi:membrane protease YdiL (CAAX protease family)
VPSIVPDSNQAAKKRNLLELLLVFAAFYLPGLLWSSPAPQEDPARMASYMAQFLTAALPQLALFAYLLHLRGATDGAGSTWLDFGIPRPRAADLLWALLVALGILLLLGVLGLAISALPGGARRLFQSGFRWQLPKAQLLPLALLFSLVSGYREELFFRSYLLTRLAQAGLHPALAVAASSLLFAAGHAYQGPAGFAVALVMGVYFALVFLRMRNLHRLAWAHGLYNAVVLLSTLLLRDPALPAP